MNFQMALAAVLTIISLASPAHAVPPEGKGPGNHANHPANRGNDSKGGQHAEGGSGKGKAAAATSDNANPRKGKPDMRGKLPDNYRAERAEGAERAYGPGRRYDDQGRYYGYFDDHRDRRGRLRNDDMLGDLVYAGITAALAREYAADFGLRGYSSLPPGIRKNLARGKPIPPGIAKKVVPSSLLGRLPRHPGYEWRMAGTDLILISVATAVIADILYDVFE